MVFSTPAFLFLFLPLFLGVYLLVPARARLAWILLASWAFRRVLFRSRRRS